MSDLATVPSPADELATFVTWASVAFYEAEAGHNDKVTTFWDAFHYVATSLSVGYANIFPVTEAGKIIGGVVMMVGPAISARALEATRGPDPIEQKLDAILEELKKLNAGSRDR